MKKLIVFTLALVVVANLLASCKKKPVQFDDIDFSAVSADSFQVTDEETDYVLLDVADYGQILIRLYPDVAPETVKNFKKLVSEKFYDGLTFHRVIKNFMIQGGDPNGDGTGGSPDTIKGEFSKNGVENNLKHLRGVVSMARRSNDMNSASSQFFICLDDSCKALDGYYAAFGRVVDGMDVVDRIASVPTDSGDYPRMVTDEILIRRASII